MKAHHFLLFLLWHFASPSLEVEKACCSGDNLIIGNRCQDEHKTHNLNPTSTEKNNRVLLECEHGMFLIDPSIDTEETFFINKFQYLVVGNGTTASYVDPEKFCVSNRMELTVDNKTDMVQTKVRIALVCFPEQSENGTNESFTVLPILLIISVSCLALTLLVYIVVPDLRDLQGLCTMCLCGSLTLGFLHLALAQTLETQGGSARCYVIAFGMYYWLMAAFFWMNIISINMMKSVVFRNSSIPDKRIFLYYNLYGWGMPLILLVITLFANFKEGEHLRPDIGKACWFTGKVETWAFFYGPIAGLLAANILLFGITSRALWYTTSYENVTKLKSMKYKFCLYIKLFLITGISWVFELISFAVDIKNVAWLITDFFNALQGVIYLLILIVFRRRALRGLAALGLPIPYASRNNDIEEECDEIIGEEHQPAMTVMP